MQVIDYKASDGVPAREGQTVTVHYVAAFTVDDLDHGRWIERSYDREPIHFVVGGGQVLRGVDKGLSGMKVGSTRRLVLLPEEAFNTKGVPGKIPPNSTIAFEIYLISAE